MGGGLTRLELGKKCLGLVLLATSSASVPNLAASTNATAQQETTQSDHQLVRSGLAEAECKGEGEETKTVCSKVNEGDMYTR